MLVVMPAIRTSERPRHSGRSMKLAVPSGLESGENLATRTSSVCAGRSANSAGNASPQPHMTIGEPAAW